MAYWRNVAVRAIEAVDELEEKVSLLEAENRRLTEMLAEAGRSEQMKGSTDGGG